jgi:hypothetical protein
MHVGGRKRFPDVIICINLVPLDLYQLDTADLDFPYVIVRLNRPVKELMLNELL